MHIVTEEEFKELVEKMKEKGFDWILEAVEALKVDE